MNDQEKELIKQKYLESLLKDFRYSIDRFDNQSLYIAGGALGLSISFLDLFISISTSSATFLYVISVILFVITIGLGFSSHYISAMKINTRIENVKNNRFDFKQDKVIPALNLLILGSLILGLISLVVFCIVNLYQQGLNHG